MTLIDILLSILANIISDDVRQKLGEWKYRKAIEMRIGDLCEQTKRIYGEDGISLISQAAECVSKANFTQEQIINQASLKPEKLLTILKEYHCYQGLIRSMLDYDIDRFTDLCKHILDFICIEITKLEDAHFEILAEAYRVMIEIKSNTDVMSSNISTIQTEISHQSEAEKQLNEMKVKQFITSIEQHLLSYEFHLANSDAKLLLEWLGRCGEDQPSYLVADIYIALAEVEAIKAKNALDNGEQTNLSVARSFLTKAQSKDQGLLTDRINALDAFIVSIEQDPDAGLVLLTGKNDPYSISRRLKILRNAGKTAEAATEARGLTPNEMWCEQAAFVLAIENQKHASKKLLDWCRSLKNTIIRDRCLLCHAEGTYNRIIRKYDSDDLNSFSLSEKDCLAFDEILDTLGTIVQSISDRRCIDTQLEVWAIEIALIVNLQLQKINESATLTDLLSTRKPIPLILAKLAIDQQIDLPQNCIERLLNEHPNSFDAKFMATDIEFKLKHQYKDAFDSAMDLIGQATQPEQRKKLCALLADISQNLGNEEREEFNKIVPSLLTKDDRFAQLLEIDSLLQKGQTDDAYILLNKIKDETDPLWMQMFANYYAQIGDNEKALDFLMKAAEICPHPDLLWRTAAIANHLGHLNAAANILKKYTVLRPRDTYGRSNYATICMDIGNFCNAAQEFAELRKLEPDKISHAFNLAVTLAALGNTNEASMILDSVMKDKDVPLQFLMQRVELSKASGNVNEALDILKEVRNRYWDIPEFLIMFMRLGYMAVDESAAHEAFAELQRLLSESKLPPDMFQQISLDDTINRIKQHKEQVDNIHEKMIEGQASWLFAEDSLGRALYLGWSIRTQAFDWLIDDPMYRANYTIYSTNAFTVSKDERGLLSLEKIECPARNTTIVADISSLITLHRLGLLSTAAEYFGRIMIPAAYYLSALYDSSHLVLDQLSIKTALSDIKNMIDNGRILIKYPQQSQNPSHSIPYVDEYADESVKTNRYCLKDLLNALHLSGRITEDRYHELLRICSKQSRIDLGQNPISIGQEIQMDLSTMRTLSQINALQDIADAFSLHISSQDKDEVIGNLDAIEKQQQVRQWHLDLWKTIRDDSRFVTVSHIIPPEFKQENHIPVNDTHVAGLFLAKQVNVPLLVDDRVFQMVTFNERQGNRNTAFSTDHLLLELYKSDFLTIDQFSNKLLEMMKWRYKFLVPPPEVLKHLASQYTYPPGKSLQEIASYVHDCMRDIGLFTGMESTETPQTMAFHLFQEWVSNIVDFIMEVWADPEFNDDRSKSITEWAINEFLPMIPQNFAPLFRARIAYLVKNMVVTRALLKSVAVRNPKVANDAIQTITYTLGIDPNSDEYLRLMTEFLDLINLTPKIWEETNGLFHSIILQSMFFHRSLVDLRTTAVMLKKGFQIDAKFVSVSEHVSSVLENSEHPDRFLLPPGPMIGYCCKDSNEGIAIYVVDYLFSPDKRVRKAAISHFEKLMDTEIEVLSSHSKKIINTQKNNVLSDDSNVWIDASILTGDAISNDFLCNLAGVCQSLQMQLKKIPYIVKILHPSIDSLSTLQLPVSKPNKEQTKIKQIIEECVELESLQEICDHYYKNLGHLPLAGSLSLAHVVENWLERHGSEEKVWSEIWNWANECKTPIARYHACSIFAQRPDLVPSEMISDLWNEILEIVHPCEKENDFRWTQAWTLRCQLAKYYALYIECTFPGIDSEKSSAVSWWFVDRLSSAFEIVPELISFFIDEISKELQTKRLLWNIAHPLVLHSELGYATLHLDSLWSLSLQCLIGKNLDSLIKPVETDKESLTVIGTEIMRSIFLYFPVHTKSNDEAIYSFELSLLSSCSISSFLKEDTDTKKLLELGATKEAQKPEDLCEKLENMVNYSPEVQCFFSNELFVRANTNELPEEVLWKWISDNEWIQNVLFILDNNALSHLLNAIIEIQVQFGGKWASHIPQIFASACELDSDNERREIMFGATVISAMTADTVSAIDRLVNSRHRNRYKTEIDNWRKRLRAMQKTSPPWIAAKIRATLTSLSKI